MKKVLIGLFLLAMMSGCANTANKEEGESTDYKFKVATFNIDAKANNKPEDQQAVLDKNEVDIAGLQEVDNMTKRNPLNVLEGFKIDPYKDIHFSNAIGFQGGEYGLGIVSKFSLLNKTEYKLYSAEFAGKESAEALVEAYKNHDPEDPATDEALSAVENQVEPRILQRVEFKVKDKTVAFYNTHLSWEDVGLRKQQIEEIISIVDKDKVEYKIIVGDFNVDQSKDEMNLFLKNYVLVNGKEDKWIDTYIGKDDSMKVYSIDNIVVTKNISISDVQGVKTDFSDHKLLTASLELN